MTVPDVCPYCGDDLPKLKFICAECEIAQHLQHEVEATQPEPATISEDNKDD